MNNTEIVYVETEYSCAFCGLKDVANLTIDHIDGRKSNTAKKYDNLIVLCHSCHHRKTTGKGIVIEDIKKIKKALMIKTLTPYGVNALKLAAKNSFGVAAVPFLLWHIVEMGLLKEVEEIASYGSINKNGPQVVTESRFEITTEGQRIYNTWFRK